MDDALHMGIIDGQPGVCVADTVRCV
jgi:hypothetical protein